MPELPATQAQLAIYRELKKINQAYIVLWFVLGIVTALTGAFLYCLIWHSKAEGATVSALLDGLFGWCLKAVVNFHFPRNESLSEEAKGLYGNLVSKLKGKE